MSVLAFALMTSGLTAIPAMAQEKAKAAKAEKGKATVKNILENDKVKVYEATFRPGDVGAMAARPYRIIRVLKGGTLERVYPGGKTEKVKPWKAGEVREVGPDPEYSPRNVGKTTVHLYVVQFKQVK